MGWVSQFGEINDKTADDCVALNSSWNENIRSEKVSECKAWFKTQFLYRDLIKKQFIRQWQIAPDIIIETYASPAFKKIRSLVPAEFSEQFKTFTAKSLPTITVDEKTISDGYTFLIHVPWSSLPPQQQLELNKLKIRLDIYNSGIKGKYGPYSSTSPSPKYGQMTSFNDFQLNQPRKYKISSCDYPMNAVGINNTGKDNKENETYYYFPDNQTLLDSVFVFENRGRGYQYSPELPSPLPSMQKTFSKQIELGLFVCGPRLSLVKDGRSIYSELTLEPTYLKPENESIAKEVKFKKINAEDWLLTLGAGIYYSSYGSGQCGACPRHILQIFHLNSNAGFKKVMDYNSIVECTDEMLTDDEHIEVSDDLKKITMYAKKFTAKFNDGGGRLPPPWMKAEVCLKGSQYSDCYSDMVVTKKEDLKLAKTTSTPAKSVCNH